jgi:hypothetical protein
VDASASADLRHLDSGSKDRATRVTASVTGGPRPALRASQSDYSKRVQPLSRAPGASDSSRPPAGIREPGRPGPGSRLRSRAVILRRCGGFRRPGRGPVTSSSLRIPARPGGVRGMDNSVGLDQRQPGARTASNLRSAVFSRRLGRVGRAPQAVAGARARRCESS